MAAMAKPLESSDEEFVELEEDDGEIVVIKSVSQLLKEANMELNRRQDRIQVLNQSVLDKSLEIQALKKELAFYRNTGDLDAQDSKPSKRHSTGLLLSSSSSLNQSAEEHPQSMATDESFQKCPTDSLDDFDVLSSDKCCQTDFQHKRVKHKATQTRFNKQPQGIFQEGIVEFNSDDRKKSKQENEKPSFSRISLSTALGWPNAFKEVGLNMICHMKQTMDPFNMTSSLENDTVIKDLESIMDGRTKAKNTRKTPASISLLQDRDCSMVSDGNHSSLKNLVKCPYCYEEMDSCCMQRHIQSMCGTLDIISFY